ncbi:hypothetical protein Pfo_016601 [Paulownia fortunei]|nr:hypothetical protein Pfo_016601 [Paulownia fortunei]
MLLDYDTIDGHDDIGLAVDFEAAAGSYHFKLVMVDIEPGLIYQSVLRFSVIVPPSRSVKSRVDFVCESFTRMENQNIKPVYAHGCLHWLGQDGTKIVAFNVEKEQARIINGPVEKNNGYGFQSGVYKWFGFSQGSLQFVYTLPDKIIIHVHNHLKNEWQVRHKIANICNPRNNDYKNGIPLFFDGERLFLQLRKRGKDGEIYMHEILSGKWEKKGVVRGWSDSNQLFIPFFPTLAKVSDQHLHNSKRWLYLSFRGLQQLLRHP